MEARQMDHTGILASSQYKIKASEAIVREANEEGFYLAADDTAMHAVHAIQLSMLLEIDRVCREENIEYYLLFGTLLGAVRHGGFIPWDDDIDIGVMRKDYDRLLECLGHALDPSRYHVQYASINPKVPTPYAKLRAKETEFREQGRSYKSIHSGVFLDIFPLDDVPDSNILRNHQRTMYFLTHFPRRVKLDGYRTRFTLLQGIYERRAKQADSTLWKKNLNAMTRFKQDSSELVIAYPAARSDYDSAFIKRSDLGPATDIDFCGFQVMAPKANVKVLEDSFGDYMAIPPKEMRRGHFLSRVWINHEFWADVLAAYVPMMEESSKQVQAAIDRNEFKEF